MRRQALFETVLSFAIAVLAGTMLEEAFGIDPPANVFPIGILSVVAVLAFGNGIRAVFAPRTGAGGEFGGIDRVRVAALALALVAYALLLPLGYIPVTFTMLVVLYLVFANRLTLGVVATRLLLSAVVAVAAFYGFHDLLGVSLPVSQWLNFF